MTDHQTDQTLTPGLTVIASVAVDRIDNTPPTPGGCPSFIAPILQSSQLNTKIVTKVANADHTLFADLLSRPDVTVLEANTTCAFDLNYATATQNTSSDRELIVEAIGDPWTPDDIMFANPLTQWVHLAPLLRSDFPIATLAALRERGHKISYDAQGLVRVPQLGPLYHDADFDPAILSYIDVLKLASDESDVILGPNPTPAQIAKLKVPEVLITRGTGGADIYAAGLHTYVPVVHPVRTHATGAGEVFAVSYALARAQSYSPATAAVTATSAVADVLSARQTP
jgi:sugar/nucleoside kinase (ribokinase family)